MSLQHLLVVPAVPFLTPWVPSIGPFSASNCMVQKGTHHIQEEAWLGQKLQDYIASLDPNTPSVTVTKITSEIYIIFLC